MKQISINHVSHGIAVTGGFIHEQFLLTHLCSALEKDRVLVTQQTFRTHRIFKGWAQLKLIWFGLSKTNADVNIVSNWIALYALLRNLFSNRKVMIVWHHHDEADIKTSLTKLYMKLLFMFLKLTNSKRVSIVVVSNYWIDFFKKNVSSSVSVLYVPNLFNNANYIPFKNDVKQKQIYLGQWAFKNDERIIELAHQLKSMGYYCFFSTMNQEHIRNTTYYDVLLFANHEDYLRMVAESEYTLAFVKLNEGWNRVAHESILVGTPVIGVPKGGLKDLLEESNSLVANTIEDFTTIIKQHQTNTIHPDFIFRYDESNIGKFIPAVIQFIRS